MTLRPSVQSMIDNRRGRGAWTDVDEVRADLALHLAGRLDDGCGDRDAAAVSKELRQVVSELAQGGDVDAFDTLVAELRAEVGDTKD